MALEGLLTLLCNKNDLQIRLRNTTTAWLASSRRSEQGKEQDNLIAHASGAMLASQTHAHAPCIENICSRWSPLGAIQCTHGIQKVKYWVCCTAVNPLRKQRCGVNPHRGVKAHLVTQSTFNYTSLEQTCQDATGVLKPTRLWHALDQLEGNCGDSWMLTALRARSRP